MRVIKYLWQLPQHLFALLLLMVFDMVKMTDDEWLAETDIPYFTAISLGEYRLYFRARYYSSSMVRKHEYGHSRQSLYLGPLYLIVIGLPSLAGNLLHRIWNFDYYKQPWEKWADVLGGVERRCL